MTRATGRQVMSLKEMEALMKTDAAAITANLGALGSSYIHIGQDKTFSYKDTKIGAQVDLIIMAFTHVNTFYAHAYDPKNPAAPNCFAISDSGRQMQPCPTAPEPQSEGCDGCPNNVFGSAGEAKACKNTYRLAVLDHEHPEDAEMAIVSVPPTSMKVVNRYFKALEAVHGRPPMSVITRFSFDPSADYPLLELTIHKPIDDAGEYVAIRERRAEAVRMINEPFDGSAVPMLESRSSKKTPARKSTPRKKTPAKRRGRSKY